MPQPSVLDIETLQAATAELVRAAGLGADCTLHPLPGGGNNRVFRVDGSGGRALLKAYFQHPEDRRDRLGAEYSFCAFAWANGVDSVPRPLAQDRANRLGLYEFIDGRKPSPEEIADAAIGQATAFFSAINRHKHLPAAADLPVASEAFFRLADHLRCIERRLGVLREMERSSPVNEEAADFVREQFAPAWQRVRGWVEDRSQTLGLRLDEEIPSADRCLSPSDFGFHNALWTEGGRLRFLDFEYAGWDDPAKMICDFFCQVAMPLAPGYFGPMREAVAADLAEPQRFRERVVLLMPVYRIKWCCIVLNEFVRVGGSRRRFAQVGADLEEKKVQQLAKARRLLHSVLDDRGLYGLR